MAKQMNIGSSSSSVDVNVVNGKLQKGGTNVSLEGHTHSQYLTSHQTLYDNNINWGGTQLAGGISPVDAGCTDEFGHNKLAFLPPQCIAVEYSRDGGATWIDYGLTDSQKTALVTTVGSSLTVGCNPGVSTVDGTLTESNYKNYKLRITLGTASLADAGKSNYTTYLYTAARKLLINVSTTGAQGVGLDIYYRKVGDFNTNTNTWVKYNTTQYKLTGWSGWNSIPLSLTFGGSPSQTTNQCRDMRLIFDIYGLSSTSYSNIVSISDIRMIGITNWTTCNELARAGHMYTFDTSKNVTFPAQVTATQFNGSLNGKATTAGTADTANNVAWANTNHPTFATVATSGSYNDLSNKPTIPSAVTESTVSGWGFTKNTGTLTSHQSIKTLHSKTLTGTGDVTLTAADVGALPNTTTIPTVTDTYSATSSSAMSGKAVASAISGKGTYSKPSGGIPATDLAESYYLASNPSGYTTNKGTVTKVNNTSPDANGNVTLTIPSGAAASKGVDTSISASSTSVNLPTSAAVASFVEGKGYKTTDNDTKNTAGSTDTSSKIYLVGATSQEANPQTYSDNEVYTTNGTLTTKSIAVGGGSAKFEYDSTIGAVVLNFS